MLTGKGKTINGKCNHKRMCFKYVEEINRDKKDPQDLRPIKQTRKLHSVSLWESHLKLMLGFPHVVV